MGLLDDAIREHLDLKRRRGADPTEVEREEREVLGPVRRRGEPVPDDPVSRAPALEDDLDHEPLPHPDEEWEDEPAAAADPRAPVGAFDHEQTTVLEPEPYEEPAAPSRYAEAEREMYGAQEPEQQYPAPPEPHGAPVREPFVAPEPERFAPDPYAAPEPSATPEPTAAPEPAAAPEREPEPPAWAERRAEVYRADHGGYEPPVEEQTAEYNVEDAINEEGGQHHPPAEGEEDVLEETPEFLQDTPDHDRLWFEQRPPRDFDFDG